MKIALLIFLLDNNETYGVFCINEAFLTFCPLILKVKRMSNKTRFQAFLKIIEIEVESLNPIQDEGEQT